MYGEALTSQSPSYWTCSPTQELVTQKHESQVAVPIILDMLSYNNMQRLFYTELSQSPSYWTCSPTGCDSSPSPEKKSQSPSYWTCSPTSFGGYLIEFLRSQSPSYWTCSPTARKKRIKEREIVAVPIILDMLSY